LDDLDDGKSLFISVGKIHAEAIEKDMEVFGEAVQIDFANAPFVETSARR